VTLATRGAGPVGPVTPQRRRTLGRGFPALTVPGYRLFASGQLVSVTGTALQQVAQDWLVVELTGRAVSVGVVSALQFAPVLVFGVYGGLVADRYGKRRILITTQIAFGVIAVALAALAASGHANVWVIYVLAAALGCVTAFDMPARQGLVAEMVGPELIASAVALNNGMLAIARIIGPALAGVLITTVGTPAAFLGNGLSYLAVIASLIHIRPQHLHPPARVARGAHQIRDGLSYVWGSEPLRSTLALMSLVVATGLNLPVILPILVRLTFHGGAGMFAFLSCSMAAGSVLGALLVGTRRNPGRQVQWIAAIAASALVALVGMVPNAGTAAAVLLALGVAVTAFYTLTASYVQTLATEQLRGRVLAVNGLVYRASLLLGALALGAFADAVNAQAALLFTGATTLILVLAFWATKRMRPGWRAGLPDESGPRTGPPA